VKDYEAWQSMVDDRCGRIGFCGGNFGASASGSDHAATRLGAIGVPDTASAENRVAKKYFGRVATES
jgi:hypothetical protein